jgi:hypothetical protein
MGLARRATPPTRARESSHLAFHLSRAVRAHAASTDNDAKIGLDMRIVAFSSYLMGDGAAPHHSTESQ